MLKIIRLSVDEFPSFIARMRQTLSLPEKSVRRILESVRKEGDRAVLRHAAAFDRTDLKKTGFKTTEHAIRRAYRRILKTDPSYLGTLRHIIRRVKRFHERQIEEQFVLKGKGEILGQLVRPVERVLIYVPGGRALYPSSIIMNVVPAQLAGVPRIYLTTPVKNNQPVPDEVLAVLYILGIREIYHVGGAQAIAGFAFGTDRLPRVDKVFGPGNIYVTLAKKMLIGNIGLDMMAGPSEVVCIAGKKTSPDLIALDMLAQAEHDERASSFLITPGAGLAEACGRSIRKFLRRYPDSPAGRSIKNCRALIVAGIREAFQLSNLMAPEHLQIMLPRPFQYLPWVKNAGSVFLGEYTPAAAGDYYAGPNHTLPTMGSARFYSQLGVYDFIKRTGFSGFTKKKLQEASPHICAMADREGLKFHKLSVISRTV